MYQPHPSPILKSLFSLKPFQGAEPKSATFLFVGLDANYDEEIELKPIFKDVLSYHENGVKFWNQRGVHHPFLLPQYSGDGHRYHRSFARIGFRPEHATLVSFVELLDFPTVGRSSLTVQDLDPKYLQHLNSLILEGSAKYIFLSAGVARLMKISKQFPWLRAVTGSAGILPVIHSDGLRTVYLHLHFSNYGKFQKQMDLEADAIRSLLFKSGVEVAGRANVEENSPITDQPNRL
ncbi:hypothetical protein [Massilia sp. DWR3-1-1]|uniref:hypothetical protein n=1 Tax=Massilia sp. DWR3-1-1 TaxID=2804559 RepID=UPI003CF5C32D